MNRIKKICKEFLTWVWAIVLVLLAAVTVLINLILELLPDLVILIGGALAAFHFLF